MQSSVSLQYLVGGSTFIGQTQTSGPGFTSVCTICSQHLANWKGLYQSYCNTLLYFLSRRTQLTNHLSNSYKIVIKVKAKTNLMTSSFYLIIVTDTWSYTGTHRQEYCNSYLDWKKDLIKKISLLWIFIGNWLALAYHQKSDTDTCLWTLRIIFYNIKILSWFFP